TTRKNSGEGVQVAAQDVARRPIRIPWRPPSGTVAVATKRPVATSSASAVVAARPGPTRRTKMPPAPNGRPVASSARRHSTRIVDPGAAFFGTVLRSVASTPSFAPADAVTRTATASMATATAKRLMPATSPQAGKTSRLDRQLRPRPLVPGAAVVARVVAERAQDLRGEV